jgi:hypothetical protein
MVNKLFLTAIIPFFSSNVQIRLAMAWTAAFLALLLIHQPYVRENDDKLHMYVLPLRSISVSFRSNVLCFPPSFRLPRLAEVEILLFLLLCETLRTGSYLEAGSAIDRALSALLFILLIVVVITLFHNIFLYLRNLVRTAQRAIRLKEFYQKFTAGAMKKLNLDLTKPQATHRRNRATILQTFTRGVTSSSPLSLSDASSSPSGSPEATAVVPLSTLRPVSSSSSPEQSHTSSDPEKSSSSDSRPTLPEAGPLSNSSSIDDLSSSSIELISLSPDPSSLPPSSS